MPDLLVDRVDRSATRAVVRSLTWRGMRCLIEATSTGGPATADLRLDRSTGPSVVAAVKALESDGTTSLLVDDDTHETASLVLVLLDRDLRVIAQRETRVGVSS